MDRNPSHVPQLIEARRAIPEVQGQLVALKGHLDEYQAKLKSSHDDLACLRITLRYGASSHYHIDHDSANHWQVRVNELISRKTADVKALEVVAQKAQEAIIILQDMNHQVGLASPQRSMPISRATSSPTSSSSSSSDHAFPEQEKQAQHRQHNFPTASRRQFSSNDGSSPGGDVREGLQNPQSQPLQQHVHRTMLQERQSKPVTDVEQFQDQSLEEQVNQALAKPFEQAFPDRTDQYLGESGILKNVPIDIGRVEEAEMEYHHNNTWAPFDKGIDSLGPYSKGRVKACWVDYLGGIDPNQIVHESYNAGEGLNSRRLLEAMTNHIMTFKALYQNGEMSMKPLHFYQWRIQLMSDKLQRLRRSVSSHTILLNIQHESKPLYYDETFRAVYKRGKELLRTQSQKRKRDPVEDSCDAQPDDGP